MAAPLAVVAGHTAPPDAAAEVVTPAMSPIAPRDEELDRPIKNLTRPSTTDGSAVMDAPPATGVTPAAAPETTGG